MSHPGRTTLRDLTMIKQDVHSRARAGGFPQAASQPPSFLDSHIAQGTTTMRRLSEPIQRMPGDLDPTSQPLPMSIESIMQVLQAQMMDVKQENEQTAQSESEGFEEQAEMMFIESLLETNPQMVLNALMQYLQKRAMGA